MRQIVVISGKGGTGKTVLTASLAALTENAVLADADVDAANLHLLLAPAVAERHRFSSGATAVISKDRCIQCGKCLALCRFGAVRTVKTPSGGLESLFVDGTSCEGCGVCSWTCPVSAIEMRPELCGSWFVSKTRFGPLVHARLAVGAENSGKLVALVREKAREIAGASGAAHVLIDGPPGIGCPVIAAISGVSKAVVVTEPTVSGVHDLERVLAVARHFDVPAGVVVNKSDINPERTAAIEAWCRGRGTAFYGTIPYSEAVKDSVRAGRPHVETAADPAARAMAAVRDRIFDGE